MSRGDHEGMKPPHGLFASVLRETFSQFPVFQEGTGIPTPEKPPKGNDLSIAVPARFREKMT